MPSTIGAVLGAVASAFAIATAVRSLKREPMRLAPGVKYELTLKMSPRVDDNTAGRIIAAQSAKLLSITHRGNATYLRAEFTAIAPREVAPGETLFQLEGRKATVVSIKEL